MGKTIRFSVPDAVRRKLCSRAACEGLMLSALLLRELEKIAKRPTERKGAEDLRPFPYKTADNDAHGVAAVPVEVVAHL